MPLKMTSASSSEPQREREVQRYLQSWQVAQGSAFNVALNVDSIARADLHGNGYVPRPSADKALTAFAQLAVLRLNLKRCTISLLDATTQIILSEATRSLSLGDEQPSAEAAQPNGFEKINALSAGAPNDGLWLGASILSRPDAVCEHALFNTCTARNPDGKSFTTAGLIVSDCRLDSRFERRPYVVADTGAVRFYAGVPIISRNGHFIGVLAVADELPRDGLTVDELQFMQHLARVVMDHLEWARDRVDRFKGERIVRSLAAFIEGSSTVHDETETAETTKGGATGYSSDGRPPEISLAGTRRPPYSRHQSNRSPDLRPTDESPPEQPHKLNTPSPAGSPIITPSKLVNRLKPADGLSRMYHRAADLLRHSALADGVVLLGAATHIKPVSSTKDGELMPPNEEDPAVHLTSGSESFGPDSSDSDTAPSARACRILAYSLADQRARADIEEGSALSLGTLEKYFSLFPKGKTFSFTDQGAGVSSEDDSASDREPLKGGGENGDSANESGGSRRRRPRIDHRELLKKIPGAKTVVFLPLYDYAEDRLAGGCFLWTSVTGRMMNLDEDLSYLRAFGNSIMSQVGRINTQKNEAAKTTFIASMSHELRSPLHGILGAVEFLKSTNTSSHQTDLVNSIYTCGKTLLDTLNHVLDYSKINRLGRVQIRRGARQNKLIGFSSDSLDSLNMTGVVDLAVLVEEVVDSIAAGHTFKKLPIPGISEDAGAGTVLVPDATTAALSEPGTVSILMDVCSKTSWMVKTQPGALRRIIMNLFGNALKYTTSGVVMVSLRGQVNAAETKVDVLIRVMDTGKGMSEDFQRNRLFVPFSQEDTFQPGTGLGLSIVKQIVDSLGGSLELRSQQYKGTEVDVRLRLPRASEDLTPPPSDEILHSVIKQTRGRSLMIMGRDAVAASPYPGTQRARKLSDSLSETCSNWFGLRVTGEEYDRDVSQPDMYLYCEPPSVQVLEEHFRKSRTAAIGAKKIPIIIVCPNAEEAARISRLHSTALTGFSSIVEVIAQPCGPRKLAKAFNSCLNQAQEVGERERANGGVLASSQEVHILAQKIVARDPIVDAALLSSGLLNAQSDKIVTTTVTTQALPTPPSLVSSPLASPPLNSPPPVVSPPVLVMEPRLTVNMGPRQRNKDNSLHVLLVDDNEINLRLLVMFMKKCGFTYQQAENGQEAVDKFKEAALVPASPGTVGSAEKKSCFDFILMDISMPIMNGLEATKHIRDFERDHDLASTHVIALTGLASADARRDAKVAGVDLFLPKPVSFVELKKLLIKN